MGSAEASAVAGVEAGREAGAVAGDAMGGSMVRKAYGFDEGMQGDGVSTVCRRRRTQRARKNTVVTQPRVVTLCRARRRG